MLGPSFSTRIGAPLLHPSPRHSDSVSCIPSAVRITSVTGNGDGNGAAQVTTTPVAGHVAPPHLLVAGVGPGQAFSLARESKLSFDPLLPLDYNFPYLVTKPLVTSNKPGPDPLLRNRVTGGNRGVTGG